MIKQLLLAALLALGLRPAAAQTPAPGEPLASQQLKQHLRGQYLHSDTAQAIITLYSRRQAGGVSWMVGATLSALRLGLGSSTSNPGNSPYYTAGSDGSGNMGGAFLIATPLVGYGLAKLLHYSNAHLQAVLTNYAAGQPLPHALRRKLKPRFFRTPIVTYKPVKYKPA